MSKSLQLEMTLLLKKKYISNLAIKINKVVDSACLISNIYLQSKNVKSKI